MSSRSSPQYDSVIIGAGHNGLICAAYLAKAGHNVLVLEASQNLGGLAETRAFHPGFKASIAHSVTHVSKKVCRDLKLESHGFSLGKPLTTVALDEGGHHIAIDGDSVSGVGPADSQAYPDYRRNLQRFADMLEPVWHKTIPRLGHNSLSEVLTFAQIALKMRLLGKETMGEFLRIFSLPMRDLMDENFESDLLKAALSWDALIGSNLAPRSPNHAVLGLLYRMAGEYRGIHALPIDGIDSLIGSLASAARGAGAEIRPGATVEQILTKAGDNGLVATGVKLIDGDQITASRVISSADPQRTFLGLLGARNLDIEFTNRIARLRCDGYVAKLHLAIAGMPEFTGIGQPDGRLIIAPDMDAIECAFDDAKYGRWADRLLMEILIPSAHCTGLSPADQHVLSAHVMYVPRRLKDGWTDQARQRLYEQAIDTIARYAPGIRGQIIGGEILTPEDIEQTCNVTGGHWHHTEFALDQLLMMRPTYGAAQYQTPISGLHLCGAGSHPGGDLSGGPGHNAAQEILR